MKKIIIAILTVVLSLALEAQDGGFKIFYGMNISRFHTGSGHGSSYVMNTNLQKGRKALNLGMVYQGDDERISGADVKYKVFLGKNAFIDGNASSNGIKLKPYLHYNCIYHSSKVNTPDFVPTGVKKSYYPELPSSPGTIATMEHYTGAGIQLFLSRNVCMDGSIGIGTYIGSLDKLNAPNTIGIHKENHGFVLSVEFGMGYKFGV